MRATDIKNEHTSSYIEEHESTANKYVMRCFGTAMLIYTITYIMNLLDIFIIDKQVMTSGYFPSLTIFLITFAITKIIPLSNPKIKFIIFFIFVSTFTIIGATITYHAVLISFLPFLCATLYSSKRFMRYVYVLTVASTFITVYGGYYFGLCDANMALLTTKKIQDYVSDGQFILTQVNENPVVSLFLFFVLPRCLIFIAFSSVCNSIYTILNDSVEKARLTSELEKAKTEAENANLAKTKFIARISHEIRTPINAVIGINEMIMRESDNPDITQYSYDIKDSSMMLLSIVNDILDSSKIESGKMEIVPVNYSMKNLLHDIYNMTNIKAKDKNLELVFDVDPTIPCEYFGDDKRIRQVLLNILSNAVKYTEKGTVTLKLSCKRDDEKAVLSFSVKDTGIGIKEEDIDKIYDEFQRIDISRNRNVEGTGLGMTIVQMLLKLMGSELRIESEYEKGSVFSFDLEQKIVKSEPIGDFRSKHEIHQLDKDKNTDFIMPDAKVLVVDDNLMNIKVFKGLLKKTQMQVFEATSGFKCIDMVKEHSFDIIFLDHMMPEMDGIETLHRLREEKLCDNVPVVMLTANAISGDKEMYISEGFDDFLSKPIIPKLLDEIILKFVKPSPSEVQVPQPEIISAAPKTSDDIIDEIEARLPEIDTERGLTTCIGDEDFYIELFTDFVELTIKEELVKFAAENDHHNYCIRIHSFKNSAYSVGATALGDLSFEMEKLSRESLPDEIKEKQQALFEQYDKICKEFLKITQNGKR